jgi:GTPase SAR1 family protein
LEEPLDLTNIAGLKKLDTLEADSCHIGDLGPLARFKNLQRLCLSHNQITDLAAVTKLGGLTHLFLADNHLSDIDPLGKLTKLVVLDLSANEISNIRALGDMPSLLKVDLSSNQIVDVTVLGGSDNFEFLDLSTNKIKDITELVPWIRNSGVDVVWEREQNDRAQIVLRENPLEQPPTRYVKDGPDAVRAYFDEIIQTREHKLADIVNRTAKLVVIGNSTAGKTTLIRYLCGTNKVREDIARCKIESTHGLQSSHWTPSFQLPDSRLEAGRLEARVLDFGGQDYYHNAHHLYFTDRTAYLVLWEKTTNRHGNLKTRLQTTDNHAQEEEIAHHPLEYWLEAITLFIGRKRLLHWDIAQAIKRLLKHRSSENATVYRYLDALQEHCSNKKTPPNPSTPREIENLVSEVKAPSGLEASKGELVREVTLRLKEDLFGSVGVITVQNKVDLDGRVHVNAKDLKERFPCFLDNVSVSVHEGTRMDYLEGTLLPELFRRLGVGAEHYPGTYELVLEEIKKKESFEIGLSDLRGVYDGIMDRYDLPKDEDRFQNFLAYAQSINELLYFPESPILKDKVFLHPVELSKIFYTILDKRLVGRRGEFSREDAIERMQGRYPKRTTSSVVNETDSILKLMEDFKMIFRRGPESKNYIVPQYLPRSPRRSVAFLRRLFGRSLFRYQYSGYIHASIMLHFYSEYGQYAETRSRRPGLAEDYLFWRNGIFIRRQNGAGAAREDEVVLVTFNQDGSSIDICPREEMKRTPFIDKIVETIDCISAGQDHQKLVSVNGHDFVSLERIYENARAGIQWFELDGHTYRVPDFAELLPDDLRQGMAMKKVFISYASEDRAYAQALLGHLAILRRTGAIDTWYDQELKAGDAWDATIRAELKAADIILLLLSPDFLNSDYIWDVELSEAITRRDAEDTQVVPIIVRPCGWNDLKDVSELQIPRQGAPITLAHNEDKAWTEVVNDLKKVIEGTPLKMIDAGIAAGN